ncbi:MAG: PhoU domain-containing protein [Candidatus Njordarchaeales archaeon]|mgnify:FL=1
MKELRKIQRTGGATYIISLPKAWVKQQGLRAGDIIVIESLPNGKLLLSPYEFEERRTQRRARLIIHSKNSINEMIRDFVTYYLAGYDLIEVRFDEGIRHYKNILKSFVRERLIGVEIIEESAQHVLVQCIVRYNELPLKKAIERMSVLGEFMIDDAIRAFVDFDKDLAEEVIRRDNEVDRFYFYIVRQLKQLISEATIRLPDEMKHPREFLGYRLVVKSIERVADHASKIALSAKRLDNKLPEHLRGIFIKLSRDVRKIFRESITSFLERNGERAHTIIDESMKFSKNCDSLFLEILSNIDAKTAALISLVLDSIKRIADYSADIAEITINVSIINIE